MSANNPRNTKDPGTVAVSDWVACRNSGEDILVLSCTVSTNDSSTGITGIGLLFNDGSGHTLASVYTELSDGSATVSPAINLAPGELNVGDEVVGAVQGVCDGQHFFFEQELTISNC